MSAERVCVRERRVCEQICFCVRAVVLLSIKPTLHGTAGMSGAFSFSCFGCISSDQSIHFGYAFGPQTWELLLYFGVFRGTSQLIHYGTARPVRSREEIISGRQTRETKSWSGETTYGHAKPT